MSLLVFMLACGDEIEFQDLTAEEPTAEEATAEGSGPPPEAGSGPPPDEGSGSEAPTEDEGATVGAGEEGEIDGDEAEHIEIGEDGVDATAGDGTGAHATIGGDKGVDVGAGGERGGAQIDVANGAFEAEAGGGEEFRVKIGKNNEVGIQGKKVKVGNKEVDFGKDDDE